MIVLHLTWLLSCIQHVTLLHYLPNTQQSGSRNGPAKYLASRSEIPFHTLIVYNNLYCSGTLIRSRIVLTAASCLPNDGITKAVIKIGSTSITGAGQIIPVVDIKIHEYYRSLSWIDNDIALLMLKDDVYFGDGKLVKKAIVVEPEAALRSGIPLQVSGWGSTNLQQSLVNQLIWTEMTIVEKKICAINYSRLLSPSNFCAKYIPERHLSDNGGPAVYNRQLVVGILSYGGTSNEYPYIAILTNVSYFSRWILLNTKRLLEKYCKDEESYISDDDISSSYST